MKNKHTKGPWSINHWTNNGASGISCKGKKDGIAYFSGDAVTDVHYNVVAHRDTNSALDGSFEGVHIATIKDRGPESMANAKLLSKAPDMYELVTRVERRFCLKSELECLTESEQIIYSLAQNILKEVNQ